MNPKFIATAVLAVASLVSVNAFAAGADGGVDTPQISSVSTATRAQVRAEALTVQRLPVTASNLVDGGGAVAARPVASQRNRADVRAEAEQARASTSFTSAPGRA